jgi:hypothetical protein
LKTILQLRSLLLILVVAATCVLAQGPTGSITGTVTDESGAIIPNATVTIKEKTTDSARTVTTTAEGTFTAAALPAGVYEVRSTVAGFRTIVREATVETGSSTTVDLRLQVGQSKDVVTVEAATAQIEYQHNGVEGVITRQQIQNLPLNGRSFLNLASLEPGVTVSPGTTSQYNALFSVSILGGASGKTSITVDGGNIRNAIEGGSGMNFSQEVVQEFQLASTNFDLSTGITSVGAVNVVTRNGSNDFHGSGYFFFRDHNLSAYPGLKRNLLNPDPFFVRRNPGFWIGGPIKKDKLFFFFNYEYLKQTQVFTFVPNIASAASLTGNYPSPYQGKQLSARFDYALNQNHHLFARYSHDGNSGFGPNGGAVPPSNWLRNTNWSDQTAFGITSTLRPTLVNEFRFNYQYWQNRNLFPNEAVCAGCLGLNLPQISINGTNITIGNTSNATQGRDLRRFQYNDTMNWQKGTHSVRFGGEFERAPGTGFWGFCDPACLSVASPETVRGALPASVVASLFPTLPTQVRTIQDVMNLPFLGGVIGVGDPSQPPPYNVGEAKLNDRLHFFAQDSWRVRPRFTLNYGLAWSFESTLVNRDLDKPKFLAPIYGSDLSATNNNYHNFSPALGFAWQPDRSSKTVIRGGFGIYYDTEYLYRRLQERAFTGPVGNGRIQYPTGGLINTFPGIFNISTGVTPVPIGAPVPANSLSNLTLAQYLQLQNAQLPAITASLAPKNLNDLSIRNIDISKAGNQLYPKDYPVQRGLHFNLGVQHQLRTDMVLSVDFVRRVYLNVLLGEMDLNRYERFINGVRSPVIPACTGNQASIVGFPCSTGAITFWVPAARQVYNAMLVKLDKRFAHRTQFTVSYALQDQHGYNTIYDLDNWRQAYGPQNNRHVLNASAVIDLPWGFQLGIISSTSSQGPVNVQVNGVALNGSGVKNSLLPGLAENSINRGAGKAEIAKAVADWNQNLAGKKDALGKTIPQLILPSDYSFGRAFNSQDLRLTKTFTFKERYKFSILGEGFNMLNYANLQGYGTTIDQVTPTNQTFSLGQPTSRAGQVFGSGGPRAFQFGGRFQF